MNRGAFRALVGLACAGALTIGADSAQAGFFQLRSCMAAKAEGYDSGAFSAARSSSRMVVKRGCNPFGRGERGLITSNKLAHRRLRRNEHASVVLWTPPGTRIFRVDWSGKLRRSDCGFTVELYAVRPGARPAYIKRERAGRHCPTATTANASYAPPRHYNTGAATALVQRVICRSKHGCSAVSSDDAGDEVCEGVCGGFHRARGPDPRRGISKRTVGAGRPVCAIRRPGQRRDRQCATSEQRPATREVRSAMQLLPPHAVSAWS